MGEIGERENVKQEKKFKYIYYFVFNKMFLIEIKVGK